MAYYEKRGKKTRAVVSVMQDGARHKISKTFDTKKAAKEWATIQESDKFQGKLVINSDMLFADYFKLWFETYKKQNIRHSTYINYITEYHNIMKYFESVRLSDLTEMMLQQKIDFMGETMSKSSVVNLTAKIKASLKDAEFDGFINKNIYSRLKAHGKTKKKSINYLSANDFQTLRTYLYDHYSDNNNLLLLIAAESGARIGEVLAITYADVDFKLKQININKSLSQSTKDVTAPKNESSIRTVKLPTELINLINKMGQSKFNALNRNYNTIYVNFKQLLNEIGLPSITLHGLRHSHASFLLYNGISINYVSKRLGHKNTLVTQEVYAHILKEEVKSEQEKVIKLLATFPEVPTSKKKP